MSRHVLNIFARKRSHADAKARRMNILVWQWGKRGGGPRYATALAAALRALDGDPSCGRVAALLSLSIQAEIMQGPDAPDCALSVRTYGGLLGLLARLPGLAFDLAPLARKIRRLAPDVAICAMPSPLDLLMAAALRREGIPFLVVVHDADVHPGDGFPLQMTLQRRLVSRSDGLVALTGHVADRLRAQNLIGDRPLIMASLPPLVFGPQQAPPGSHGGPLRLLSFGRLLPYKGLDLLAEAIARLGPRRDIQFRVVGRGPESAPLNTLRTFANVTVENRWVPEDEVGALLAWSDALVLSHREASQSGVAAAAIAARRWVLATRVGGLAEQLRDEPLARLCDPTADSLADAIRRLTIDPPQSALQDDPGRAWRGTAIELVQHLRRAVLRSRPAGN
jgi:glycosyltransferase involved in cell wall biosynthesis